MVRTQTDLQPGSELLGFRVERVIGRGGMGVVYLAHQLVLDRMVALKLLAPELAENAEFRERFLRESRLAASLDHSNIVPVHDAGEVEGRLYIAMRYVEGRDLGVLLEEEGPLEPERAAALLAPIADALDAAHAKGLVHRDVKPSNILTDRTERPYLADFGLTKEASEKGLVEQSHFAASVEYVAPEQIEGKPVDGRADQYALACVLFEALTGSTPFANGTTMATLWGHLDDLPPRASERNDSLSEEVDSVFEHALAKSPDERYATCTEFVDAAREALGLNQSSRFLQPRWLTVVAGALALLVAGAVFSAVFAFGGGDGPKPDLTVRDNSVVRLDAESGEVVAVIDVGRVPTAIAAGGENVWVYNWEDQTVSLIDAELNVVVETRAIAGRPYAGTTAEHAVDADDEGAWVVTTTGLDSGVLTRLRPGLLPLEYQLDHEPQTVTVGEGWVWVTARSGGHANLLQIDPGTGTVDRAIPIDDTFQRAVVGEGSVWTVTKAVVPAPNGTKEVATITRIDPKTLRSTGERTVLRSFDNVGRPFVDVCGGALWVEQPIEWQRLLVLDARSMKSIGTKPLHVFGQHHTWAEVACGEDAVWWMATGGVRRLDVDSHAIEAEIPLTEWPVHDQDRQTPEPTRLAVGAGGVWMTIGTAEIG